MAERDTKRGEPLPLTPDEAEEVLRKTRDLTSEHSKAPDKTPEPTAFEEKSPFERMKEFTRRLIAVPKKEIQKGKEAGHRPSPS